MRVKPFLHQPVGDQDPQHRPHCLQAEPGLVADLAQPRLAQAKQRRHHLAQG